MPGRGEDEIETGFHACGGCFVSAGQALRDVQYLAGQLPHRGGITENERLAAEYLLKRFKESTPHSQIEDFYSIDAYPYLFSMYYAEFFFVAMLAFWIPWVMLGYGLIVFVLYMAEFTGYSALSRFLPHYETQNVSARFPCDSPERLLVLTAHYDSPKAMPWTSPAHARWLRTGHMALVGCMILVLASCAAEGLGTFDTWSFRVDLIMRWSAVSVLIGVAFALYTSARGSEFTHGANKNASGAALLLALADRFREDPLKSTEVWLVATGSKEMWLSGMRQLFRGLDVDKSTTYFLNVDGVGAGSLRYVTGEGMQHVYSANKELTALAERSAAAFGARPMVYRGLPTDALIPLARGYKAMTIMATVEDGGPGQGNEELDRPLDLDADTLDRATEYVLEIARSLDAVAPDSGS